MHWGTVHDPTGPADDEFLQAPSTASSGRKLMTEILGGRYAFLFSGALFSSSINISPHRKLCPPHAPQPPLEASDWLFRMGSNTGGLVHSRTSMSRAAIFLAESLTD